MTIAHVVEFAPQAERSTTNYDAIFDFTQIADDHPAGLLLHFAGFTPDGAFRVIDVWESAEDQRRFAEERLLPAIRSVVGDGGSPPDVDEHALRRQRRTRHPHTTGSSPAPRNAWLGSKQRPTELHNGTILMGMRAYVPQLGRFLQVDPVLGGSANPYDYVNQDPISQYDLAGLCSIIKCVTHAVRSTVRATKHFVRKTFRGGPRKVLGRLGTAAWNGVNGCLEGADVGFFAGLRAGRPDIGAGAGCALGVIGGQYLPTGPHGGRAPRPVTAR